MGRLIASLCLILLIPGVLAISDPAGDVGASVGGAPVDAPYVDILEVTSNLTGQTLDLQMTLVAAPSSANYNGTLEFTFTFAFADESADTVYGREDGVVACHFEAGRMACKESKGGFLVTAAGINQNTVTTTLELGLDVDSIAAAGAASNVADSKVVAQDFTDNFLPYQSRPSDTPIDEETPDEPAPAPWWKTFRIGLVAILVGGGAYAYLRFNRKN